MDLDRRLELQALLAAIPNVTKAYYQPPNNLELTYPCIVYERSSDDARYANNDEYRNIMRYTVTVIDRDPDSEIPFSVRQLRLCRFSRHFVVDNLHHDVFNLYF